MEITASVSTILGQKGNTVWSISPDATVFEALQLMSEKNVGAIPVVDGNKLVGILSERDYTRKVVLVGRSSKETPVKEIMTAKTVTAEPGDTVGACMRRMTANKVRHLPVMKEEEMLGIISIGDLVNFMIKAQAATIDQLESYLTGGTYQ